MVKDSEIASGGIDQESPLGQVSSETDYERSYLGHRGWGALSYAPTATASSSKTTRASRSGLSHALNDMGITMKSNRGDTFGYVSSCALALCETMQEIKDRSKIVDIFGPAIDGFVNAMATNGMAIEIEFLKGLYNGLFGTVPDDHKVRDPNAGVLRTALGMAADATGLNFVLQTAFGAEDGLFTRRVTLEAGEVFSRAVQQEGAGLISDSSALKKLERFEKGGKEKFLNALEEYGEQLDKQAQKRYPTLSENERKSLLKSVGSEIGHYITSNGVRPAKEGEEPGVYLNGITKPSGKDGTEGKPINLNDPRDVGILINMLTGPKLFVHPQISKEDRGPDLKVPDAAPDMSDPSIYPKTPLAEADTSVLKERIAAANLAADAATKTPTPAPQPTKAADVEKPVVSEKDRPVDTVPAAPAIPGATVENTPAHRLTAATVKSDPRALVEGEISLEAAPAERRGTLIMGLFKEAGITAPEMLQLLGLLGKDDRYEATARPNPATGDETTYIKIFDAAGNEKILDKNGVDQKVPPELRGTDKELTIPELRLMLAEKMLEPEKENNLAVALQRRETANMLDVTLNRLDTDAKTIAAALGDGVAVGEGKDHPVTFIRADGKTVTVPLKEYLNENPKKVDALAEVVIQQVIQAIPEEKRAEAFGIKEGTSTSIVLFEDSKISTRPAQTLNEYLAQHPEAVEKASYQIVVEREKTRGAETVVSTEPPLAPPAPPNNDIAGTLKDLAKELGLQVHAAHHDAPAPNILAAGKENERSGGGRAGK